MKYPQRNNIPAILYPTIIRFPLERANGIQIVNTCHALARKGHPVVLFVLKSCHEPVDECLRFYGLEPLDNLHVVRVPFLKSASASLWNASAYASCFPRLCAMLLKERNPVVYTRDMFFARLLLPWAKAGKGKLIYECHHLEYIFREELPRLYAGAKPLSNSKMDAVKRKEREVYRRASGIVVITQKLKEMICEIFHPKTPVEVIRDGCAFSKNNGVSREQKEGNYSNGIKKLLYVGDLNPLKGVELLLRVMKALPENVRLTLAGGETSDGTFPALKKQTEDMGLSGRVDFQGYIQPSCVRKLYDDADVLLLPLAKTTQNAFFTSPLKMFEYMTVKKPIVAADFVSIREVLTHEKTALLVPPDDESAWARAVARLLDDASLCRMLSLNACALAADYTWDRRAEKILQFVTG